MATPRKPRKPRNVVPFTGKPVRTITAKGVVISNPYEQLYSAIDVIIGRDGIEAAFHMMADHSDRMRRILAKEMLMRSSG